MGSPTTGRRTWVIGAAAFLLLALAVSVRRVAPGGSAVREGGWLASAPALLGPGWHLAPRGFYRLTWYRTGEGAIPFGSGTPLEAVTPQGARVVASGRVEYRLDPGDLLALHARGAGSVESLLADEVARALTAALAEPRPASRGGGEWPRVQEAARERLAASLQGTGLTLVGLRFDALGYQGEAPAGAGPRATPRKVLWIGVDSFDWDVIRPLVSAGRMPNVAGLLERGAWGNLRSITPMLSPVIWTSVATGKKPDKHGIIDFVATDPSTGAILPVTSTLRRSRAFWNILGDAGVSVGVVAWWASFPAERVNGFLCTDRIAYQLFKGQIKESAGDNPLKTFPAEVYGRIAPLIRPPESIQPAELQRFIDMERVSGSFTPDDWSRVNDFRTLVAATHTYADIGRALFTERPTDLRVIYFEGPDTAAHLFMPFVPPVRPGVDPKMVDRFGRVVPEFYAWQDELIGQFVKEYADDQTTVVISSDHGFLSGDDRPATESRISHGKAADWHDRDGMILMAGPAVKKGARILGASVLDMTPTLLALYGLPMAQDMDGKPLTAALTDEYAATLPGEAIASYETGEPTQVAAAGGIGGPEAQELLEKLESLGYVQQDKPTARVNQGAVLMQAGQYERAVEEYRAALKQMNEDGIRQALVRALRMARRPKEAEAELEILAKHGWKPAAVLTERAALRRDAKDWPGAESLLKQALAADPQYADAHMHFGRLYEAQDRWEDAVAAYRRATAADGRHGEAFNQLGLALRRLGRADEAVKIFEETIQNIPDLPGPYNNLGLIYRERGELERARKVLETGVQMAPRSAILRNSLGSLLHDMGKPDEALEQIQAAVESDPNNAESLSNLAVLHMARREPAKAEPFWRKLMQVEPANTEAPVSLGMALLAQGKGGEAEGLLTEALKKNPGDGRALVMLGEIRLRGGRPDAALPLYEKASQVKNAPPRVWNGLARCYLAMHRNDEARRALKRSLALDPAQPEVSRKLAELGG